MIYNEVKEEMINQNNLRIFLFVLLLLGIELNMQAYSIKETPQTPPKYSYTGWVKDSISGEPLVYATVSFANEKEEWIRSGVTNDSGFFEITLDQLAVSVKISFVGYKTYSQSLGLEEFNVGEILLSTDGQLLDEVSVSANAVEYKIDRLSHLITEKMRSKASNAQELLDQIHGVRFDKLSNSIKVGSETAVLLLVEGVQYSQEYIKNLSPDRIAKVEVVTEPSGRFLADGYGAIINFILKEDYQGYDIRLSNFSMISLAGYNGKDWLINDQPSVGVTYTKDKWNVFANYGYANIHMNTPVWKNQSYVGVQDVWSEKTGKDNPNNQYGYQSNYLVFGVNYQLLPKHTLSFQGDYTFQNINDDYLFDQHVKTWDSDAVLPSVSNTKNKTRDKDYVGTLFYKGEIGEKIKLYSDFTYNYYSNNINNKFTQNESFLHENLYRENKRFTNFNVEGDYTFSSNFSLNLGYANIWRKYSSKRESGEQMLDYSEHRNQLFTYFSYRANDKLNIKVGGTLEYLNRDSEQRKGFWNVQPYFQLNYKANQTVNMNLSYLTNSYYPSLYQLSPMTTAIDSLMMQSGNSNLKSAVRHTVSAKITLWDRLTFNPMFKYTPKRISEIYTQEERGYISTFGNIKLKQFVLQATYDQPLGQYFSFSSNVAFYHDKASYKGLSNSYSGWLLDADLSYFNPRWSSAASVGYYRSIDKGALLQGYQMVNMDSWMLSVQKQFWKQRVSLMVSYFPPIHWGVRNELKKEIQTPFYTEKLSQSLMPYRNLLMVSCSIRFNSGKTRSSGKKSSVEREQRAVRAAGF